MKKMFKSNFTAGILVSTVILLGTVFAGNVTVKNGNIDTEELNVSNDLIASQSFIPDLFVKHISCLNPADITPELVQNGGFDSEADWYSDGWSINGTASWEGVDPPEPYATAVLQQELPGLVAGKKYVIKFTAAPSDYMGCDSSDSICYAMLGGTVGGCLTGHGDPIAIEYVETAGNSDQYIKFVVENCSGAGRDIWIDDVSVKEYIPWTDIINVDSDVNMTSKLIVENIAGPKPYLGNELVTSGSDFTSGAWSATAGWTKNTDSAVWNGAGQYSSGTLSQTLSGLTTGKTYAVKFTLSDVFWDREGYMTVKLGGTNYGWNWQNGTYQVEIVAGSGDKIEFCITSSEGNNDNLRIMSVSVKEIVSDASRDINILDTSVNVGGDLAVTGNISASNLTDASETTKGLAKFSQYDFVVVNGEVSLKTVYTIGDDLLNNNAAEASTGSLSAVKVKETEINAGIPVNTTLRIKFDMKPYFEGAGPYLVYAQVYRNGTPVGTFRTVQEGGYTTFSEDIGGWSNGDLLQLYAYSSTYDAQCYVRNLKITGTIAVAASKGSFTNQ